jgi:hypothetical protein
VILVKCWIGGQTTLTHGNASLIERFSPSVENGSGDQGASVNASLWKDGGSLSNEEFKLQIKRVICN